MGVQSQDITNRQYVRTEEIAAKAGADTSPDTAALRAILPAILAAIANWKERAAGVKEAARKAQEEGAQAIAALKPLGELYDRTREVVMLKVPAERFPAASTLVVPTDFLAKAEDLEDILDRHREEPWAKELFELMVPTLDTAVKEMSEGTEALNALQKAQAEMREAAAAARPLFVRFRRIVRATYGRSSREYRSLLDRQSSATEDDEADEPQTPAAS